MTAKVVANDTLRMLTLLKVEADGLVPARAAAKESIKVGQWAIAVGRAAKQLKGARILRLERLEELGEPEVRAGGHGVVDDREEHEAEVAWKQVGDFGEEEGA